MEVLLQFLELNQIWIYIILGLAAVYLLTGRLLPAIRDLKSASFGLERDKAQTEFNGALALLVVILILLCGQFVMVTIVSPAIPRGDIRPTPTLDLLSTSTPTLSLLPSPIPTENSQVTATVAAITVGCLPGQIEWTDPVEGGEISGTVTLKGTVNLDDFGFYKFEYATIGNENWVTISSNNARVVNGELGGKWDTSELPSGDYRLRLLATYHDEKYYPACIINIRIVPPES